MDEDRSRAIVRNAADPKQVRNAEKADKDLDEAQRDDLRAVLATVEGRRFLWRLIGHCRTFESVWIANAQIHYNAGQQDIGHFLIAEITGADESAYVQMIQESWNAEKIRIATAAALRQKRIDEEGDE